ncbi:MAG: hypothetical protein IOC67_14595, partial [Methylobacterium sp.]|nr:hypothetical protein [Methylobacterium sp.]
ESEETAGKFKKMGVDLRKEMAAARKNGENLVDAFARITDKALKGDMSKLPQLFSDQEFARGMRALLNGYGKLPDLIEKINNSTGAVANNLKRITSDTQATLDRLSESAGRFGTALGQSIAQPLKPVFDARAQDLNTLAEGLERANKAAQDAQSSGIFSEVFNQIWQGQVNHSNDMQANNRRISDRRILGRMHTRSIDDNPEARGLRNTIGMLENLPSRSPAQEAALKRHKARLGELSGPVTPNADELGALSREIGRSIADGVDAFNKDPANRGSTLFGMTGAHVADFARIREMAHHMQDRAPRFSRPLPGLPIPPERKNRPGSFDVAPLDDAVTKVEAVKNTLDDVAAAAKTPGPALAASVKTGVDQAIADLERLNSAMRGITMPGIGRGFPTGRSMSEVE